MCSKVEQCGGPKGPLCTSALTGHHSIWLCVSPTKPGRKTRVPYAGAEIRDRPGLSLGHGEVPFRLRGCCPDLDHLGEITCISQFQHNVQLVVFDERVQILDDVRMVQLLHQKREGGHTVMSVTAPVSALHTYPQHPSSTA